MVKVTGVRFKKAGKIYYFDPEDLEIKKNDDVIVETARGIEYGKAVIGIKEINEEEIVSPLKNVIRIATEEDREKHKMNKEKEKEAFDIFIEKIEKHNLIMKLIDVEYTFDNNKIIFYFTADGRVDFRELVKDLASVFRTRIELRQIGVRDEAKMISGLGPCGRPLCCSTFLGEFVPVSIKMAKEQNLSLNPSKISGICGRLMCCLTYEQESYEDVRERMPRVNSIVNTPFGKGTVVENNLLRETLKVRISTTDNEEIKLVKLQDVELINGHYEGDKEYEEDIKKEIKNNKNRDALEELFKEN
ncbi:PSP1 domain-containing protein [Oceanirhabdus seepicola]|uniref:Stage 0 sporulation family protein n=1 Tax=Oceanirhabdus seepicola TaxID=2828781 RepID=A0A9J6P7U2_9CLOT|nr:stage 0 sporulation family protein [Oceanirhabdus seepicola]MCM1992025.1 stage 0 sporulation family protein [Oceanirhabdus seepicola]